MNAAVIAIKILRASITVVSIPSSAARSAVATPAGPPPMTTRSVSTLSSPTTMAQRRKKEGEGRAADLQHQPGRILKIADDLLHERDLERAVDDPVIHRVAQRHDQTRHNRSVNDPRHLT